MDTFLPPPPSIRLMQAIWFLSEPWPHLGGLRELVTRVAFHFESDAPGAPKKKVVEGCAALAIKAEVDEAALTEELDAAEAVALTLPMQEALLWRMDLAAQMQALEIPHRLLSLAAADAGLRVVGLPFARGFPLVWEESFARQPQDPVAEWLMLESTAQEGDPVIPGIALQQQIALAQARGEDKVALRGPWERLLTHIPQRESAMMADMHGDLYAPGAEGPCVGGTGCAFVHAASVAQAVGLGYAQTVETHRRRGIGRLRGR